MTEKRQSETPVGLTASVEDAKMHDLKRKNPHDESLGSVDRASGSQGLSSTSSLAKRMKKLRCGVCKQKTGLASSYTCRCGTNFCAGHRYPELHQCSFDYREAGKDVLRKMHPLIRPQKIEKI
ncbi:zinc finger A20 and AN1 domain-containing stress-associated protein 10 [Galendromus occidentalis]|uniref:Zinc finger A20 and AN1 domain-containing stress-associated protein 10 n=1 Tax=Galendromus occidentalis TaxID=34638 RepID=A0AAJ6QX03_9ACAR|nr:zinc finger A20 and AN1 domain-containing stress-associated protein 10 [Galendromus occidentalis]